MWMSAKPYWKTLTIRDGDICDLNEASGHVRIEPYQ